MKPIQFLILMIFATESYGQLDSKYGLSVFYGSNKGFIEEIASFSVFQNANQKMYKNKNGKQFGIHLRRSFSQTFAISSGLEFETLGYSAVSSVGIFNTSISENIEMLSIPILINWKPTNTAIRPFIQLGFIFSVLTQGNISGKRSGGTAAEYKNIDVSILRSNPVSSVSEVGFEMKSFFLAFRYSKCLTLLNDREQRYALPVLYTDLQYVDSDFKMDRISVNAGYIFNF